MSVKYRITGKAEDHVTVLKVLNTLVDAGYNDVEFEVVKEGEDFDSQGNGSHSEEVRKAQGKGPQRAWQEAREYAEKNKIFKADGTTLDVDKARKQLADAKRKKMLGLVEEQTNQSRGRRKK